MERVREDHIVDRPQYLFYIEDHTGEDAILQMEFVDSSEAEERGFSFLDAFLPGSKLVIVDNWSGQIVNRFRKDDHGKIQPVPGV